MEILLAKELSTQTMLVTLVNRLQLGSLAKSLAKNLPTIVQEIQERAEKYIHLEEAMKV